MSRAEVKAIVVEAFEILIACEKRWRDEDLTADQMQKLIRVEMAKWRDDPELKH